LIKKKKKKKIFKKKKILKNKKKKKKDKKLSKKKKVNFNYFNVMQTLYDGPITILIKVTFIVYIYK